MSSKNALKANAASAKARAYASPTVVLLAMDWPDGKNHPDFLGFAISRSPGFAPGEHDAFLLNKIGFAPTTDKSQPIPSNLAPFQKFLWWDGGINTANRGKVIHYEVIPVLGSSPHDLKLQANLAAKLDVKIPLVEEDGISTYFNRAVVSSQAFVSQFATPAYKLDPAKIDAAMKWLANGMEDAIPTLLKGASSVRGAIYHLTDNQWVIPELKGFADPAKIAYFWKPPKDTIDQWAVQALKGHKNITFAQRTKTAIMHNKFLVDVNKGRVLAGSANFTPEGLTSQANVLHIFRSSALSKLYRDRADRLAMDPSVPETAKGAAWSPSIPIGGAQVRVFFSPEPTKQRVSIDTVVKAVNAAKRSVIFCMFSPTDAPLLNAMLAAGDKKKILFGLLNSITDPSKKATNQNSSGEEPIQPSAATQVQVTLYNRSRKDKKVLAYAYFRPGVTPSGFLPELSSIDLSSRSVVPAPKKGSARKRPPPAVHIHHKFIVIDAETDAPTIYTGSANMSNASVHRNDENLLEIKGAPRLAQLYFAEFMRLYEHFRARALWNMAHPSGKTQTTAKMVTNKKLQTSFTLKTTRDQWVKGAYKPGTAEYLARTQLAD